MEFETDAGGDNVRCEGGREGGDTEKYTRTSVAQSRYAGRLVFAVPHGGIVVTEAHNHTPDEERRIREAALDETLAGSFPASAPPSSLPNPDEHDAEEGTGVEPAVSPAIRSDSRIEVDARRRR